MSSDIIINHRYDHQRNPLSYIQFDLARNEYYDGPFQSLRRLSLISKARNLWYSDDIMDRISRIEFSIHQRGGCTLWGNSIERLVLNKIANLKAPKFLLDEIEEMVKSIGGEIIFFLRFKIIPEFLTPDKYIFYFNKLCWTFQGTINNLETASKLLECSSLGIEEKYTIACYNCLEPQIRPLIKDLTDDFINNMKDNKRKYALALYWYYKIGNDLKTFLKLVKQNKQKLVAYLFDVSEKTMNDVLVQHILENFSEPKIRLFSYVMTTRSINSSFYILSKMDLGQIQITCTHKGKHILVALLGDWRWRNLLIPMSRYIVQIRSLSIWVALEVVLGFWVNTGYRSCDFIGILENFIRIFDHKLKEDYYDLFFRCLYSLFNKGQKMIVRSLLRKISAKDKEKFLIDKTCVDLCCHIIKNLDLECYDIFVEEMIGPAEAIEIFNKDFYKKGRIKIWTFLMTKEPEEKDKFVSKFCSEEHIASIKMSPYSAHGVNIYSGYTIFNDRSMKQLDVFLGWCFDNDKETIEKCKRQVFDPESESVPSNLLIQTFFEKISSGSFKDINQLTWACLTELQIKKFKNKILRTEQISIQLLNICFKEENLQSLKEMLTSFLVQQKVDTKEVGLNVVKDKLHSEMYEEAKSLLKQVLLQGSLNKIRKLKELLFDEFIWKYVPIQRNECQTSEV